MTVDRIARENVVTASPGESIADAAARMRDENVGSLVVTEDDRPVGIVTDRDVAVRVVAEGEDPESATVADAMTEEPATFPADGGVFELTDALSAAEVRRMPVVDDDGTLEGILTLDDLNQLLARELDNLAEVVEAESPPY